ncbi:MAG: DUF2782 domain-containing protein [Pseudomonadales bacterium]
MTDKICRMNSGKKLPYLLQRCRRWLTTLLLISGSWTAAALAEEAGVSLEGPDVTIIAGEERTVYEFRQNGQLRMVRVIPKWGKPYYLVPADPTKGFGDLERAEMLLPSWVIAEF